MVVSAMPKCECVGCEISHLGGCRTEAIWNVELHPIDNCGDFAVLTGNICNPCLDSCVERVYTLILESYIALRPAWCLSCLQPFDRLSHVIKEVSRL